MSEEITQKVIKILESSNYVDPAELEIDLPKVIEKEILRQSKCSYIL